MSIQKMQFEISTGVTAQLAAHQSHCGRHMPGRLCSSRLHGGLGTHIPADSLDHNKLANTSIICGVLIGKRKNAWSLRLQYQSSVDKSAYRARSTDSTTLKASKEDRHHAGDSTPLKKSTFETTDGLEYPSTGFEKSSVTLAASPEVTCWSVEELSTELAWNGFCLIDRLASCRQRRMAITIEPNTLSG